MRSFYLKRKLIFFTIDLLKKKKKEIVIELHGGVDTPNVDYTLFIL